MTEVTHVLLSWSDQPVGAPWKATVTAETEDGWKVRLVFGEQGDGVIVRELHMTPLRRKEIPLGGLSNRRLRRLSLEPFLREAVDSARRNLGNEPRAARDLEALLEGQFHRTPGRRSLEDVVYARIAIAYEEIVSRGSRKPIIELAEKFNYSPQHMRNLVARTRKHGFLDPATRGKAEGRATKKTRETPGL